MSQDYENADDFRKVFVSRLPLKWKDEMLKQHFESCFGGVEAASINWDKENDFSLGYGFVTFLNEDGAKAALDQGSMHVQRKIIQIRPVLRDTDRDDTAAGGNSGVCFLWQKGRCVKGDSCKFSHTGEGACIAVAEPYHGLARRKCLSFKSKGKCSKGDACHFLHIGKEKGEIRGETTGKITKKKTEKANVTDTNDDHSEEVVCPTEVKESSSSTTSKQPGICHSFKKKGKCRKGDKCIFAHNSSTSTSCNDTASSSLSSSSSSLSSSSCASDLSTNANGNGKRKRIDGSSLVKHRKKMLAAAAAGGRDESSENAY